MPKRMLPRRLSNLISRVRSRCAGNKYPQTAAALEQLEIAVRSECKLTFRKSDARVVWASVKECPLGQRRRYFLLIVKCMTHQTGLSAKCGVEGSAASTANSNDDVTGMATRLFKYLINDYYEELCTKVTNWIARSLNVVEHDEAERTFLGRGQDAVKFKPVDNRA